MEDKKIKYITISLIVILFIGILILNILKIKNIQELNSFEITVTSWWNRMPSIGSSNNYEKVYFVFELQSIDKETFLNEYEIESIKLNGKIISNKDISYEDSNGFRFISKRHKKNNEIKLIIKNKATNKRYSKNLTVSTDIVY